MIKNSLSIVQAQSGATNSNTPMKGGLLGVTSTTINIYTNATNTNTNTSTTSTTAAAAATSTPFSKHRTLDGTGGVGVGGLGSTNSYPHPPLGVDKAALGIWQQFAAKFGAMRAEISKWTSLQDALLNALTTLSSDGKCV